MNNQIYNNSNFYQNNFHNDIKKKIWTLINYVLLTILYINCVIICVKSPAKEQLRSDDKILLYSFEVKIFIIYEALFK